MSIELGEQRCGCGWTLGQALFNHNTPGAGIGHATNVVWYDCALSARTRERDEALRGLEEMNANERVLTCAFCGHQYPPSTPTSNSQTLADHIRVCAVHPIGIELRKARAQAARDHAIAEAAREYNKAVAAEKPHTVRGRDAHARAIKRALTKLCDLIEGETP